jgi:menaquinone-dependent protoporphyrinogen IX oxidase
MDEPHGSQPQPDTPDTEAGGRALVVYATRHGSTQEVADAVAGQLRGAFAEIDVHEVKTAPPPAGYDAVVVGGPMIMGWHRDAKKYLKHHRDQLSRVPFALFVTAASLTEDGLEEVHGVPVAKDTWLVKKPRNAARLTRKERYALPAHYVEGIAAACGTARPRSIAFFAGSLDLTTMNIFEKLFVLLVIGATPGDGRHYDFIREWAAGLGNALHA